MCYNDNAIKITKFHNSSIKHDKEYLVNKY